MKTVKEIVKEYDEMFFAEPELLELNVVCYKCRNKPIDCKCDDKWRRLSSFKTKIHFARVNVLTGYCTNEDRKLTRKFGI